MKISYKILKALLKGIGRIPFGILYGISAALYPLVYHVVRYRRKIVSRNLAESFPEKSPEELKLIEKRFYRNFLDNIMETVKMGSMSDGEISRRMKFTNIDTVNEQLRSGRNIALFLGHYGNWEWISSMPIHLYKGAVAAQIYHRLDNPAFDKVMLEARASHGAVNVEMRSTARFVTHKAAEKRVCIIGFIADQSPRKKDISFYLPFLNHETPVQNATEKIARHYGYEGWFVDIRKVKRGYYEVEFVKMCENPKQLPENRLTEMYYHNLEEMIRRAPELYLWTHRRFKYARPWPEENTLPGENMEEPTK